MNKPIIIQGALQSELDYLLNNLTLTKKTYIGNFLFYECTYKNYPIIVSKTKMGEISSAIATTLAIQTYSPKFIINQGTAGAYAEWLNKGDIVLGEEFYYISQFSTDENKENEEINPWKQKEYRTIDNEIVSYNANQNLINWLKSLESLNSENVYFGTIGSGDVWTKDLKQIKKVYNDFNYSFS